MNRRFWLQHGDGKNLSYLNDELVLERVEVHSGDSIRLGNTTLRFQAFCSEAFDWQDTDD